MNFRFLPFLLVALTGCKTAQLPAQTNNPPAPTPAPRVQTPLDSYLQTPQPLFSWKREKRADEIEGETNLRLVSQSWQGRAWTHRVQIFTPEIVKFPDAALVSVHFGGGSFIEAFLARSLANATGATVVNLFNVPNQPLYGRTEDDLVAYSFGQFLKTGDESWPLLFPMTKAILASLDATQEWSKTPEAEARLGAEIERFIVTGASKRGWATYFAGAANDSRVVGLVPVVYDNLNIPAQVQNQKSRWGQTSEAAAPYDEIGLFDVAADPQKREIVAAIDPYFVRERLSMPKLLINATNDEFWAHNSSDFYLNDLPGPTRLYFVPNAPHILGAGATGAAGTVAAWSRQILSGQTPPEISLQTQNDGQNTRFVAKTNAKNLRAVRLWFVSAPTKDFREARWNSVTLGGENGEFSANLTRAQLFKNGENASAFAEIEVAATPIPLRLSSRLWSSEP